MTLELDEAGSVVRCEYAQVGPLYLPTAGEAYWELDSGRYVYWRGTITGAEVLDEPFVR